PRLAPLLTLVIAPMAAAQTGVPAPGGTLLGVVQDSATGRPLGLALLTVQGREARVFASESGRFSLSGLPAGEVTIRVSQIGFRAATLRLVLDTRANAPAGAPLVVRLARQAFRLPEIVVVGDACPTVEHLEESGESGTILDEAFTNAERLLALERDYPYSGAFQRLTTLLDETQSRVGGWVDTVRYDSRRLRGYRKGEVVEMSRRADRSDVANYFTTSDIAREEFRRNHCFWFAGRDSLSGFQAFRIDFAPRTSVKTADWAGSLLIDSATMVLLRSESHLVNLPTRSTFASAVCRVLYRQLAPTLAHEFQAQCVSTVRRNPPIVVERWLLVDFSFLGRTPVGTDTTGAAHPPPGSPFPPGTPSSVMARKSRTSSSSRP
ncbi:MAG TPA: carboxypeptidase regulatory-like domain-containing protein, partial [Gemmatimonadales bacterium]|nr:carboxypeptidase regulatory-like domain-containing protein [Gemmatimonadales bacterium]